MLGCLSSVDIKQYIVKELLLHLYYQEAASPVYWIVLPYFSCYSLFIVFLSLILVYITKCRHYSLHSYAHLNWNTDIILTVYYHRVRDRLFFTLCSSLSIETIENHCVVKYTPFPSFCYWHIYITNSCVWSDRIVM